MKVSGNTVQTESGMEVEEESGLSKKVIDEIGDLSRKLCKDRKKRVISETLISEDDIKKFTMQKNYTPHKAGKNGITCLDINKQNDNEILTASTDHNVIIFNKEEGKIDYTLTGHTKKVSCAMFGLNEIVISGSIDRTIRVWKPEENGYKPNVIACHTADVVGMTLHPLGKYFASVSKDRSWCFNDIDTLSCVHKFQDENESSEVFSCTSYHPDGILLGTGYDKGTTGIWDMNQQKRVAKFEGHTDLISNISFSENGYHMATSSLDGTVRIWDLRKLKDIQTFGGGIFILYLL